MLGIETLLISKASEGWFDASKIWHLRCCGVVGRTVTSNTSGPGLESSHKQNFIMRIFTINCWKDEKPKKEAGNGPLKIFDTKVVNSSNF